MKTITLRLEENLHKAFKMYSLENDTTMQDILVRKITEIVEKEKKNKKGSKDSEKFVEKKD